MDLKSKEGCLDLVIVGMCEVCERVKKKENDSENVWSRSSHVT